MENNKGDKQTPVQRLRRAGSLVWRSVSYNLWYKLFAVLIAVLVWSYALTSNPSTVVYKSMTVDVTVSGQSALTNRGFALATDMSAETIKATVRVSVSQGNYTAITDSNVRAELDLSAVRKTGKQQLRLRGSTPLGSVVSVTPESLEVEIENQDQRVLPVSVKRSGESDDYWYNISRPNPQTIVVSGPASQVLKASQARVNLDLAGITESDQFVGTITVVDAQGEELPDSLTKSANSVSLSAEIYPTKMLPVSTDINEIIVGDVPTGYKLEEVDVQPRSIRVAADKVLLDSLDSVSLEPVDIEGATQSLTKRTQVKKLDDVKNYSSESVNVSVTITEKDIENTIPNVTVDLVGLREGLRAKWSNPKLNVSVVGPYSIVQPLKREDLMAIVDLSEIDHADTYELPILVSVVNYPELAIESTPMVANVTISAN